MARSLSVNLSQSAQDKSLIATGTSRPRATVEFDFPALSPADRELLVEYFGRSVAETLYCRVVPSSERGETFRFELAPLTLDHAPSLEELLGIMRRQWPAAREMRAMIEQERRAYDQREREAKAARQQREERRLADEQAQREVCEREKREWIAAHGSARLKRAVELGYNAQRGYVTERAAIEWPGWDLDFDGKSDWSDRSYPSQEALDLLEKYPSATVVWLTEPVRACDEEDWEPCEVLLIENYLGRYRLLKRV